MPRLRFAFELCDKWGVDDAVEWYKNCPPDVLNWWMAFYELKHDERGGETGEYRDPQDELRRLSSGR